MIKKEIKILMLVTLVIIVAAGAIHYQGLSDTTSGLIINFVICLMAMGGIAHIIGEACEQLGAHYGPAVTGIIQATASSLPELFIAIFALKSGLITLVQASLIGSILGNILLRISN